MTVFHKQLCSSRSAPHRIARPPTPNIEQWQRGIMKICFSKANIKLVNTYMCSCINIYNKKKKCAYQVVFCIHFLVSCVCVSSYLHANICINMCMYIYMYAYILYLFGGTYNRFFPNCNIKPHCV